MIPVPLFWEEYDRLQIGSQEPDKKVGRGVTPWLLHAESVGYCFSDAKLLRAEEDLGVDGSRGVDLSL